MSTETNVTAPFTVIATTSSRVKELPIVNGQLIFIQDRGRIALDFKDARKFYNQITELETDYERENLSTPSVGYYFIIETAVLWFYQEEWIQITAPPEEILFIGTELPELGQEKTLYVNKGEREISIWDLDASDYLVVSNYTQEVSDEDIENLFN